MKKHILVVSQYFYPEPFRINDIAQEWVKRGYKVTVLTGIPNYPEGKYYKGYGWYKKRKETWNGIDIIRIPLISRGKSAIRLILNYYSFVISGFFWSHFTKLKADCVFTFEVSPMTQAKIGVWYSRRSKIPNYLYVQDLWPDNLEVVGGIHNKFVLDHYAKMSKRIYDRCTKIFATSPSFVETIRSRLDKDQDKVLYWPQYAEDFYKPVERKAISEIPDDGKFKIVFTGNIGFAQGLEILPKAAAELKKSGMNDVSFIIVGDGRYKEQLIKEATDLDVSEMFNFIPRQPAARIPEILAACDVAFLSFMANPLFEKTIPAKLQSYMACGMPILAVANGETERIIIEAECGFCSSIGNAVELSEKIKDMMNANLQNMGVKGREYYDAHFEKQMLLDWMDQFFQIKVNKKHESIND